MAQGRNVLKLLREVIGSNAKPIVAGRHVVRNDAETFSVINPSLNETACDVVSSSADEAEEAIASCKAVSNKLRADASARARVLRKLDELIFRRESALADIVHAESGKTPSESLAECKYARSFVQHAAELCQHVMYGSGCVPSSPPWSSLSVRKRAVGTAWAVVPWNFPLAMPARKTAPALAAGCPVVLQPAAETPLSAIAFTSLTLEALGPELEECVSVLPTHTPQVVGDVMAASKDVHVFSFTGSTSTGKMLAQKCMSSNMKRLVLELGGNAPFIVEKSADLEHAAEAAKFAKFRNAGQTCIAPQRFLVHRSIMHNFAQRLAHKASELEFGSGVGATIGQGALDTMDQHVNSAKSKANGSLLCGGQRRFSMLERHTGFYYHPTVCVLQGNSPSEDDATLPFNEETFGPCAFISAFDDIEEAISRANATDAGLVAYAFTNNVSVQQKFQEELQFGMKALNTAVVSYAWMPFGGMKESGFGREGGQAALDEFRITESIFEGFAQQYNNAS